MNEWFEKLTYGRLLERAAARFGPRPALTFGDRTWSFEEVEGEVERASAALASAGVARGDVVALWMLNRPEWIFLEFAVARLGAVLLPVNTALRTDDCVYVLAHSECSTLVIAATSGPVSYIDMVNAMRPSLGARLKRVITVDDGPAPAGCVSWARLLASAAGEPASDQERPAVDPDDLATIMYTSGTTGAPKGVMHSHHTIRNVVDEANRLNVRETDVILMFLPLFHAYGLYEGPLLSLVSGARCVLLERFDPGRALAALERERATLCFGFSAHFQDLLGHPDFAATDRSSLRAGIMAVGPRSMEALALRVQREFGGKIVSGYGMTEIGVGATLGFLDEDDAHSSATSGYPLPGYEFRIVDPASDRPCARGEAGEVHVRSYQVMLGYLKDPDRTAATIDSEGWMRTGDVGVLQEDGYVRILGRYKDMLRVGGENVDPAEVEALYLEHPSVVEAAVVGVPDQRLDEVPCLCVRLTDGVALDDALRRELLEFAVGRLASFKRPRHVVEFAEFPMTASGKTARAEIQSGAARRLGLAAPVG